MNLTRFNKAKCKVLHMGQDNPKHKYRVSGEWIESSLEEKDLQVLADQKFKMTGNVRSQPRRPWAASKDAQPAGWGR